jgi:GPH family glycoside/pentoside/hexuronide:cation symporter
MADPQQTKIAGSVALRFGVGQLGAQLFRDTPAVLLPLFLVTMLAVPAWLAGLVVLIPKLWLIVCDPLVGTWYDRTKERTGRTGFLVAGAMGTSLGLVALFAITSYPSPWIAAAVVCLIFFLGSTAFSVFSVPYLATATELSGDPFERNRIIVMRMIFGSLGVLVGVGMPQLLIAHFGGGAAGWHSTMAIFGAICLASMLTTALGLRGVPSIKAESTTGRLRDQVTLVAGNRPFLLLLLASFLSNVGQAASYTAISFVFLFKIRAVELIPAFIFVMACSSLLAKPLWLWLPRMIGKQRCFVWASLIWIAVTLTWLGLGTFGAAHVVMPVIGPVPVEHLLVLVRAVVIGVTNGGFVLLTLSIMTDAVDLQRRSTGIASEGIFAGVFSALEKFAFAVGPVIAGLVLSGFGFEASRNGPTAQTSTAILGIMILYSVVPAAMQAIALVAFSAYRRVQAEQEQPGSV